MEYQLRTNTAPIETAIVSCSTFVLLFEGCLPTSFNYHGAQRMSMCLQLPFCVGNKVYLSASRECPHQCEEAHEETGTVVSIGVALLFPTSTTTSMIGIDVDGSSTTARQMFQLSPAHTHFRRDDSVVLFEQSTKHFRICRKVGLAQHHQGTTLAHTQHPQQLVSASPKFMRVVHIFRLLLENSVYSMHYVRGLSAKENRRVGRRTLIRFKEKTTLEEWEHLVAHVHHISSRYTTDTPQFDGVESPRFLSKEMSVEVVDFMVLMRCLGQCDVRRLMKYLAVDRVTRRSNRLDVTRIVRIVADYVVEEREASRGFTSAATDGSENESIITLGCSLTAVKSVSILGERTCVVLRRDTCDWDPRDRAYTAPMELKAEKAVSVFARLGEDTSERNRLVYSGEKRKTGT